MSTKLIMEIQSVLANPNTPIELLSGIAGEYNEACESANQRLTTARKLLAGGYRDEAVQLAERFPPLLETVAELDFPETDRWRDMLVTNGIETPPILSIEAAEQIENAYDELRQFEPLLETHRMLALSQAPLSSRILILKKLAQKDPANPLWGADIERFENARLDQIKSELAEANTQNDGPKLKALASELEQPWSIPVPSRLQSSLAQKSATLAREEARVKMQPIAEKLTQCLLEFDSQTAIPLRQKWNRLNRVAQLAPNDGLQKTAEEPLAWLAELDADKQSEDDFNLAVQELEGAVEHRSALDVVESRLFKVKSFGREIPEHLSHRVGVYQQDLRIDQSRKSKLRYGIIATALLVTLGAIFWFVQIESAQRKLTQCRKQMAQFVVEDSFDAGRRYFEGLEPTIQADAEIITAHSQLLENETSELERSERFKTLIAQINLNGPLGRNIDDTLDQAGKLAHSETEKNEVTILKNKLATARLQRQNTRKEEFLKKLMPMQAAFKKAKDSPAAESSIDQLADLKVDLQNLIASTEFSVDGLPVVSLSMAQNARNLLTQVNAKISNIVANNAAESSLAGLIKRFGSPARFATALETFAKNYPNDINAADFLEAAAKKEAWASFAKWQGTAKRFREALNSGGLSPAEAKALKESLDDSSSKMMMADYEASLKLTEQLLDEKQQQKFQEEIDQDLLNETVTFLKEHRYSDIQIVERSGKILYLESSGSDSFRYYKLEFDNSTNSLPLEPKERPINAPHCEHAAKLKAVLKNSKGRAPEDVMREMIEVALAPSADPTQVVEPLVQCEYIDQILYLTKFSVPELKEFAETERERLDVQNVLGGMWKYASEPRLPELRRRAVRAIASFREEWKDQLADSKTPEVDMTKVAKWTEIADYQPVGFLQRHGSDWKIVTEKQLSKGTSLHVIKLSANHEARLKTIGKFDAGALAEKSDSSALIAGRPVFVLSPSPK